MYLEEMFIEGKSVGFFRISDDVEEAVLNFRNLVEVKSGYTILYADMQKRIAYWQIEYICYEYEELIAYKEWEDIELSLIA